METRKFYRQLDPVKRARLKEMMLRVSERRKQQIANFDDGFLKPLRHGSQLHKRVISNEISVQEYERAQRKLSEHMMALFKAGGHL